MNTADVPLEKGGNPRNFIKTTDVCIVSEEILFYGSQDTLSLRASYSVLCTICTLVLADREPHVK